MAKSRRHNWFAARVNDLNLVLALGAGVSCEDAGETTFRLRERDAGAEADASYFFGENAVRMKGPKNFEPGVDQVPDLVVEVEVTHTVELALSAWRRLGVSEVWHVDARSDEVFSRVLRLSNDGSEYQVVPGSAILPTQSDQLRTFLRNATAEGTDVWRSNQKARLAGLDRERFTP